ncbi:hypothetical protein CHS0354_007266 [Potamilus streckersoni]|uniref:Uncharacterized protein n=1 Tax=Potamilus streckersoni TaxID=2493646 RepID=A0AAE0TD71_9BIVA|nr:hypothetical protein CHS0354_007266 [Potamilus streckersoni]
MATEATDAVIVPAVVRGGAGFGNRNVIGGGAGCGNGTAVGCGACCGNGAVVGDGLGNICKKLIRAYVQMLLLIMMTLKSIIPYRIFLLCNAGFNGGVNGRREDLVWDGVGENSCQL